MDETVKQEIPDEEFEKQKKRVSIERVLNFRKKILAVLGSVVILSAVCYFFYPFFFSLIRSQIGENLYARDILEGFTSRLNFSLVMGIFLSIPFFLFHLVSFIFPVLKGGDRIFFLFTVIFSLILFIIGIVLAYFFVIPSLIGFFKSKDFFPDFVRLQLTYENVIGFFYEFLIGFGICFELPVVLIFLLKKKLMRQEFLFKNFKYFFISVFIIAAVFTPSTDVVSQIILALPMIVLLLITMLAVKIFGLGKE
jgi:sec-independent protein translocase protein TatC